MNRSYKRKMFATAVVLIVMATPLFAAQTASSTQAQKPAPAAPKPAASAAAKAEVKPAPAAAKPSPQTAKPAAAQSAASAPKAAPAAPKAPTVRAATKPAAPAPASAATAKAVTAAPKPAPAGAPKAVPAVATKPVPAATAKAAPAVPKAVPAVTAKAVPAASPLSPVQQKVQANKELTRELQTRMPAADVVAAAAGFRDLQQFVATAHASHNLSIPFDTLKGKVLAGKRTSLRQAIQEIRPAASAAIEAQRAEYDAIGTIAASEQTAAAAAAADKDKDKPKTAKPASKPRAATGQR